MLGADPRGVQANFDCSARVAHMHGCAPGQIQPTTGLVMSHEHPDDAANVAQLIEAAAEQGRPFSSHHRIVDTASPTSPPSASAPITYWRRRTCEFTLRLPSLLDSHSAAC
ncbi:MAG TPA: PAS domain-containing protein [Mycobacterium sp.]